MEWIFEVIIKWLFYEQQNSVSPVLLDSACIDDVITNFHAGGVGSNSMFLHNNHCETHKALATSQRTAVARRAL